MEIRTVNVEEERVEGGRGENGQHAGQHNLPVTGGRLELGQRLLEAVAVH